VSNGKDCRCNAHCEHECCCDADWTPKEVYDLRAELARVTAERDEARKEVFKALKEMYTTAGLRRELLRRGWWEWYKEVRP
jgi:hypothetical protein